MSCQALLISTYSVLSIKHVDHFEFSIVLCRGILRGLFLIAIERGGPHACSRPPLHGRSCIRNMDMEQAPGSACRKPRCWCWISFNNASVGEGCLHEYDHDAMPMPDFNIELGGNPVQRRLCAKLSHAGKQRERLKTDGCMANRSTQVCGSGSRALRSRMNQPMMSSKAVPMLGDGIGAPPPAISGSSCLPIRNLIRR